MGILAGIVTRGLKRVVKRWRLPVALLLVSFLFALIPTLLVSDQLEESLSGSGAAERMKESYDDQWFQEFEASSSGLASEFEPSVMGIGAVFGALNRFLGGELWQELSAISGLGLAYIVLWVFLSGGVLALFVDDDSVNFSKFVPGCGRYFFRFLRITLLVAVLYLLSYRYVFPWMEEWTGLLLREVIDERVGFLWTLLKYFVTVVILIQISILSDLARILVVVENRSRVLGALLSAVRLELRHPLRVWGVYLLVLAAGVAAVLVYWLIAPGALQTNWGGVLWALILGQIYIFTRIMGRLWLWSSQLELVRIAVTADGDLPDASETEVKEEVPTQPATESDSENL